MDCSCHRCVSEHVKAVPPVPSEMLFGVIDPRLNRMFLCAICGNKRCPHAADHHNACTGSNEPGQPGSLYASPTSEITRLSTLGDGE